jgi:hypothetical protein
MHSYRTSLVQATLLTLRLSNSGGRVARDFLRVTIALLSTGPQLMATLQ